MQELPENYWRQEAALQSRLAPKRIWEQDRIHAVLSDPTQDCPLKMLARRPLPPEFAHLEVPGPKVVRCPCGCRQSFTAKVRSG